MAIEWYYPNDVSYVSIGVDWNMSETSTSVSISPVIYRWDEYDTNNYGSYWWETLDPDPNGDGSYSGYAWGSGSGTREVDSWGTRTYSKTSSHQYVDLTIGWDSQFGGVSGGSFQTLGSGSNTWTLVVPATGSYTITYEPNGGSGSTSTQVKVPNSSITLYGDIFTRSGYKLLGWSTSKTATSPTYALGGTYSADASITLYAVWKALKTCIIKYNANGGSGAPSNQKHTELSVTRISKTLPTRQRYKCLGWARTPNATVPEYYPNSRFYDDSFTNNSTITLYAVWIRVYDIAVKSPTNTVTNMVVKIPDGKKLEEIYFKG